MAARKKKRELSEKAQKRIRQRNLHVGITVIAAIVIIFSVIQFTLWRYVSKVDEEYICKNVFIGKTDVSGMTKEEAVKAVDNTLGDYRNKQLVLKVKDQGADVSIEEMGAEVENIDKLAEKQKEAQIQEEKKRILEKKFKNSMMTPLFREKCFDMVDNNEMKRKCIEYVKVFKPHNSTGLSLIGNVGTGKTTLLAWICNELMQKGYNCLFTQLTDLLDKFSTARRSSDERAEEKLLNWLLEFDFVVLDDIGREKYTETRLEVVFKIVDKLISHKIPIGISANPEMIKKLKNIPDFAAILDRLNETCQLKLEFEGKSFRRAS